MNKLTEQQFLKRLAGIKLLSLDTDGVLTDGGIYFTDDGEELRKFNVKDGLGIKRAQASGLKVAIITSSSTPSISHRGRRLGVDYVFLDCEDKLGTLVKICDELRIDLNQVGHVGDDLNDIPVLEAVGCPMTVSDASDEVLSSALFVTKRKGGEGAVREICDLIISIKKQH
jgi:3-deoxy-D-manno-octulosonate 8-phosphate phosphatase (KDO 8-P phosphatase)